MPSAARAQTSKPSESARATAAELFKASAETYRQGDFKGTVTLLSQAYALDPQPVVLYNLGRAHEGLGDLDAAIDAYDRYLKADPKAPDRASIEQRVATLQRQRDERRALEKQRDDEREQAKAAAEEQRRALERAKQRPEVAPRSRSVGPYVVAGLGAAGLIAGGVLGVAASSKHASASSEHVQQTAIDQQDQARTLATVSTISFIAGGVLLLSGVTWWVLDAPSTKPRGTASWPSRFGVVARLLTFEQTF